MTPTELIARVAPSVADLGSAFYFTPETVKAGKAVGLDGFRLYFLGRGGVLGDVEWPVVLSAFGYFKPSLVAKMWTTGRERYPARDAAHLYLECCRDHGRARFSGVEGLGGFCEAAEAVTVAALDDPAALPLFAGLAAMERPADLPGRAMQLVATLRELRGSTHLAAVTACGLPSPLAHRIKRPDDVEAFGWAPGEIPEPTDDDRRRWREAEALTDRMVTPAFSVLDEERAAAMVAGLEGIEAAAGQASLS